MKRSLQEIADLSSNNLNSENVSRLAKAVWIELQQNKKFNLLDDLINRIRVAQGAKNHSKIAEITSAKELDQKERNEIEEKIERRMKSKILPVYKIDKNLIGGIKIKVEDDLLDVSWRGKLQLIQAKLEGNYE